MSKKQEVGYMLKGARIEKSVTDKTDIDLINKQTMEPLCTEDVFTFNVVMCDNKIDRAFEAFNEKSLNQMAGLFDGRTFIKDHRWEADNQVARIYAVEVKESDGLSDTGERYLQLVGKCYMLVTEANADLIADIKGGIKKEVSVGFRLGSAVCSICGIDNMKHWCDHYNGKEYDGKLCYFILADIKDAYELSFVAVPAQPAAGATKTYAGKEEVKEIEEVVEPVAEEVGEGEPPPDNQEKEVKTRMRLMGAFLFSQGGINEQENA